MTKFSAKRTLPPLAFLHIVILLLFFTSGCITVAERAQIPIDDTPQSFSHQGQHSIPRDWWRDFHDPGLNTLVSVAVDENFSVNIARRRIEELQASARIAGAALIPAVNAETSTSSTRNSGDQTTSSTFSFDFAASYEIDLWGRLRSLKKAAALDLQVSEEDFQTASITVIAELAESWYQLLEKNMQLDLLSKQAVLNGQVLELIETQFRSGKVAVADILQQKQLLENNNERRLAVETEIELLKHRISILLGRPPTEPLPAEISMLPELPPLPDPGVPVDLLTSRPDIKSSYLKLQASDYRTAAAVADRFPKLSITASLSSSAESSRDLFDDWLSSLAANLFGPLLDGGRRKAEVSRREAVSEQEFLRYGQIFLQAIGEVENALTQEHSLGALLQSKESQLQFAADALKQISNRYRQGVADYQRVLLALISYQNLQGEVLTSRRQRLSNRIALYRATSGQLSFSDNDKPATVQSPQVSKKQITDNNGKLQ